MPNNESALTRDCVKALNRRPYTFCAKIHGGPHQRAGLPDITGVVEGFFFGIEMKLPGKEKNVTPLQRAVLTHIEASGGITGVATSLEECIAILEEGLNARQ